MGAAAAHAVPQGPASSPYDAVLQHAFTASRPGDAAIVVKDGKVIYRGAVGLANLEKKVPVQPDTVFRLGSVTKQFTSLAIMMLVEQGKVALHDPIDKYLPGHPMQGDVITAEHPLTQGRSGGTVQRSRQRPVPRDVQVRASGFRSTD